MTKEWLTELLCILTEIDDSRESPDDSANAEPLLVSSGAEKSANNKNTKV